MSLQIGPYTADPEHNTITRHGQPVKWGEKAHALFIQLLIHSPKTTSKEDIFAHVWKGRVVTENSLYKIISKLRQELQGDDIEVESVFGEGYRLVYQGDVQPTNASKKLNHGWVWAMAGILSLVLLGWFWLQHQERQMMRQMMKLQQVMAVNKQAFISQINRRNELGELLAERFELKQEDSWEKRFYQLYDQMNEQERFLCQQTRAYTEGPLFENNQAALQLLQQNPKVAAALPLAPELITPLTLWLNKYERVFRNSEKMCLLYVGVEDGAPYPSDFDQQLDDWIKAHQD